MNLYGKLIKEYLHYEITNKVYSFDKGFEYREEFIDDKYYKVNALSLYVKWCLEGVDESRQLSRSKRRKLTKQVNRRLRKYLKLR